MMKWRSGVVAYRQVCAATSGPVSRGSSWTARSRTSATSAAWMSRSMVSGVVSIPVSKNATFIPPAGPSIIGNP